MQAELTHSVIDQLYTCISGGMNPPDAVAYCEVQWTTYKRWLRLGKRRLRKGGSAGSVYVKLYLTTRKARAKAIADLLRSIRVASAKDWKAAAFLLTRLDKQRESLVSKPQSDAAYRELIFEAARKLAGEENARSADAVSPMARAVEGTRPKDDPSVFRVTSEPGEDVPGDVGGTHPTLHPVRTGSD